MKKSVLSGVPILLLAWLLLACGPSATPTISPGFSETRTSGLSGSASKEAWVARWETTLSAAKGEGKVVLYTTRGSEARAALAKGFKDKYGLELEFVTGKGAELSEKLLRERSAGLYMGDVYMAGPTTILFTLMPQGVVDPMRPVLILPDVIDPKVWYGGNLPFLDKQDSYVLGFGGYVFRPMAINTELVKADEMKSYQDLLNPKWSAKITMADPTIPGAAQSFFTAVGHFLMGYDFLRELARQKPFIHRDDRLITEWVARGKYSIVIGAKPDPIDEFRKAGAPITSIIPKEGSYIEPGAGTFNLINKAPHPNAARVFVNWLLTKEGQTIYSQSVGIESTREDVPKGHLDPKLLREPGKEYIYAREDFHGISDEIVRTGKAREIFGELLK